MRVLSALALALAFLVVLPTASAAVQEYALPQPLAKPVAIEADAEGNLWVTLDGTWAVLRMTPEAGSPRVWQLEGKAGAQDSLYGISIAPDGTAWTAGQTHLHRVDPASGDARAFPIGVPNDLSGGVLATDDAVYVGLVFADKVARFDRATQAFTFIDAPTAEFGPLEFAQAPNGTIYLTGTYQGANTYAWIDPQSNEIRMGPRGIVASPTGIAVEGDERVWMGEHGGSAVVAADLSTGVATRYPTAPSPYYPTSGPSGIEVAEDGTVWFVNHFADRVARLDPANRTLVEYELPSSPVTNSQHLALVDGAAWVAEREKNRLARVTYGGETPAFSVPDNVTVRTGESVRIPVEGASRIVVGTGLPGLNATVEDGAVVVEARAVGVGQHLVLVSERVDEKTWVGRYVLVDVEPHATNGAPGAALPLVLAALALVGIATRRWRR